MSKIYDYHGNAIELDEATGMPKIPGGMFWRIKKAPKHLDKAFTVQLREYRKIGTRKIEEAWAEGSAGRIRFWAAHIVYQRAKKEMLESPPWQLLGDYPPNKLGDE